MSAGAIGEIKGGQGAVFERANQLLQQSPDQLKDFEQVLQNLESQQSEGQGLLQKAAQGENGSGLKIELTSPAEQEKLLAQKVAESKQPGGVEKLVGEVEAGVQRLQDIISEVQGGKTFRSQELLGLQAEMHQITLQVEVTTKVVSEVVSNVKQLMQQQV